MQNKVEEKNTTTLWLWNSSNGDQHVLNSSKGYGYISTSVSFLSLTSTASPEVNSQKKNLKQGIWKIGEQELVIILKGCCSFPGP